MMGNPIPKNFFLRNATTFHLLAVQHRVQSTGFVHAEKVDTIASHRKHHIL